VDKIAKKGSVLVTHAEKRERLNDRKSGENVTCLRGFEPPTFGSAVHISPVQIELENQENPFSGSSVNVG
jgi:hypothetical protein